MCDRMGARTSGRGSGQPVLRKASPPKCVLPEREALTRGPSFRGHGISTWLQSELVRTEENAEGGTGTDLSAFPSHRTWGGSHRAPLYHHWELAFHLWSYILWVLPNSALCACLCCEPTISSQCVPAAVASLLMPPVVFTQSTCAPLRETDNGLVPLGGQELPAASSSLLLPLQNWESSTMASRPLSRLQLQEALLNLIQVRLLT